MGRNDDHGQLRDAAAGRLVPPWMRTGGRTNPTHQLDLLTQVRSIPTADPRNFEMDQADVLIRCRAATLSITELASHMREPPLTIKVLVSDLLDAEAVEALDPVDFSGGLTMEQLEIMLRKLESMTFENVEPPL